MDKLYCSKCKYLLGADRFECWYPTNLREDSNWYDSITVPMKTPQEINHDNDCNNFEAIVDKF